MTDRQLQLLVEYRLSEAQQTFDLFEQSQVFVQEIKIYLAKVGF